MNTNAEIVETLLSEVARQLALLVQQREETNRLLAAGMRDDKPGRRC